jgi:hypothetical protein
LQTAFLVQTGTWLPLNTTSAIPIFQKDPIRCYALKPDLSFSHRTVEFDVTIYTNSKGFRSSANKKEYPYKKPEDTIRLMSIGPSFAFGWGSKYEESYSSVVSQKIRETGFKAELINAGIPAQPLSAQFDWYMEEGYRYSPDILIVTLYSLEAAAGAAKSSRNEQYCDVSREGYLINRPQVSQPRSSETESTESRGSERTMSDRFAFKNWLKLIYLNIYQDVATLYYFNYFYRYFFPDIKSSLGLGKDYSSDDSSQLNDFSVSATTFNLQDNFHYLRSAAQNNMLVVYVYIPYYFAVRPQDMWNMHKNLGLLDGLTRRTLAAQIESETSGADFVFVNPLENLISAENTDRTYYAHDVHLTSFGNQIVAEAIFQKVITHIEE